LINFAWMKRKTIYFILFFIAPFLMFSQLKSEGFDTLEQNIEELSIINKQEALATIQKMQILASSDSDSSLLIARTLYYEASVNHRQNIVDSTLEKRIREQLIHAAKPSHENNLLMCALELTLLAQEEYSKAFEIALQATENSEALNDSVCMTRSLNMMGIICDKVGLIDMAEEYYMNALNWVEKESPTYYNIKNNIFNYYLFRSHDDDFAFADSLHVLIDEVKERDYKGILLILYINASNYYTYTDDSDDAFQYLTMAKTLCEDNPTIQAIINNNLGYYYLTKKDYDNAFDYFNTALKFVEKYPNSSSFALIYRNFANTYEQIHNADSALYYLKKSMEYDNINDRKTLIMELHRERLSSSLEKAEDKLELAETEIKLKNTQVTITFLSAVCIIIASILLFILFWQKRKSMKQRVLLKEAEAKELFARLEKEQIIQNNQAILLESKLREITSYSLLLSNKNQILRQIQDVSERIPATEKSIKREIKGIIKENLQVENDWNDFMLHFNNVHPEFFERLQNNCPQITRSEQKLAAYIRLGLSTNQIAQMLNVTSESIRSNRYRLRKKIGLEKDENIDTFIQNL